MKLALAAVVLAGCMQAPATQDPYCPKGWKFDISADGSCTPPTGYTALVWAELGGSGVYGFVRAGSYESCHPVQFPGDDATAVPMCDVRMVAATAIDAYKSTDILDTTIRDGAVPVASTVSSSQGVYKLRLDPGTYRITGIDPVDGTRFWSTTLEVVKEALADCPIDVYP